MMRNLKFNLFLLLIVAAGIQVSAQLTSAEINAGIGRGINLGNTLESETEGSWGNGLTKEYFFDDYKAAGFTSVRIPIRWDKHTSNTSPYKIDEVWMKRVEQIVDWGLDRGLYIVMNSHHDDWIKTGYTNPNNIARFDSIWSQVSVYFKGKSEKLLFEMINEPNGLTLAQVNELNKRILSIIRKTNPNRTVLYSGHNYAGASEMMAASIPNDPYLIGYFHSYDPWSFAGESKGTWGSAERNAMKTRFNTIQAWSEKNQIPVTLNEFGAMWDCDYNSRMYFYAAYTEEALNHNFSFNVWDDGGWFKIYQRAQRDWNDIKDILINTSSASPTLLKLEVVQDSLYQLSWTNRSQNKDSIFIERRKDIGSFTRIAALTPDQSIFTDQNLEIGATYYYKVIDHYNSSIDIPSYPISIYTIPFLRSPFHGEAIGIPGTIEAEDYDIGGEALTYHDSDPGNTPGAYRPDEGVDVQARTDGYHVGYVELGEWLEYTINVAEAGKYNISTHLASVEGNGKMSLKFGTSSSFTLVAPATGNWNTYQTVDREVSLKAGEQILRLTITALPAFNIDKIEISTKTSSDEIQKSGSKVFTVSKYTIQVENPQNKQGTIILYNSAGKQLAMENIQESIHQFNVGTSGIIFYDICWDDESHELGKVHINP